MCVTGVIIIGGGHLAAGVEVLPATARLVEEFPAEGRGWSRSCPTRPIAAKHLEWVVTSCRVGRTRCLATNLRGFGLAAVEVTLGAVRLVVHGGHDECEWGREGAPH